MAGATLGGALIYAGVLVAPASAGNPATFEFTGGRNVLNAPSVGYPVPGSIYAPFTDCPLNDPIMEQSVPGLATGTPMGSPKSALPGRRVEEGVASPGPT